MCLSVFVIVDFRSFVFDRKFESEKPVTDVICQLCYNYESVFSRICTYYVYRNKFFMMMILNDVYDSCGIC